MKIKQLLALSLITASILCIFTGCESLLPFPNYHFNIIDGETSHFDSEDDSYHSDNENDTPPFGSNDLITPATDTEMSRISYASDFCNGFAFVQLDKSPSTTYCINKYGQIKFTLPGDYAPVIGFHNGIAAIKKRSAPHKNMVYLCDMSGHLTSAKDLGATEFLTDRPDAFADGYIFAITSTKTEADTIYALGILNTELKYVVEPSESLYSLYMSSYDNSKYYDGYLFQADEWNKTDHYIDLRTGKEETGSQNLFTKINPDHPSDFWSMYRDQEDVYFCDFRYPQNTDTAVIGPIECAGVFAGRLEYHNGVCALNYVVGNPGNSEGYFTLLSEDGRHLFVPVKTDLAYSKVISDQGLHLVFSARNSVYKEKYAMLQLFDCNGLVGELKYPISRLSPTISFADGVIQVFDENDRYTFYGADLEPLF